MSLYTNSFLKEIGIINESVQPFNGDRLYMATGDLSNDSQSQLEYVTYEKRPSRAALTAQIGDVLLARMKGTNKVLLVTEKECGYIFSTGFVVLRPSKNLNENYLLHYLKSRLFQDEKDKLCTGATQKAINNQNIEKLKIPLPPLTTQKRIAEILDAADALRRKDQELLKKYDELAQAIFIDMFGDPVKNEKGWDVKKLGDITHLITDGKHGNCNDEENSGYFFISAKDIYNDKINYSKSRQIPFTEFEEVDRRTNLNAGDIVMVNTGATIGKLAIVQNISETRKTTFQKSVAVIKLNNSFVLSEFIKYVFVLRIKNFANKGTGSAVQNLLLSEMRDFKIICPPIPLQEIFRKRIISLSDQKEICSSIESESDTLFQSLIQKAFNGELVS
jgi:type I restriction enzyme S subunit